MSNKQRHRLLIIPALLLGASITSVTHAEDFNQQPRSKKNTTDHKDNSVKGDNSFIWFNQGAHNPGADKSMGWDVRTLKQSPQVK